MPIKHLPTTLTTKLTAWKSNPQYLTGSKRIATALKSSPTNFVKSIFREKAATEYALLALEQGLISKAQFATVTLHWGAHADYKGKIKAVGFYSLSKASSKKAHAQKKLRPFLALSGWLNFGNKVEINDEDFIGYLNKLNSDNIPDSERSFSIISIAKVDIAPSLKRSPEIKFTPFMPIETKVGYDILIPSFSMLQSFIDYLSPNNMRLEPIVGDLDASGVANLHKQNKHPFGVSMPGFEQDIADTFKAGRFGFSLHDFYHIVLMAFAPTVKAVNRLAELSEQFIEQNTEAHTLVNAIYEKFVDQEFREALMLFVATRYNFTNKITGKKLKTKNSPESSEYYQTQTHAELLLIDNIASTLTGMKTLDETHCNLIAFLFADMINNQETWKTDYKIDITQVINLLFNGDNKVFSRASKRAVPAMRKIITDLLNASSEHRPDYYKLLSTTGISWCAKLKTAKTKLFDAIAKDDVLALKSALKAHPLLHISKTTNQCGKRLIDKAVTEKKHSCIAFLISKGVDVNHTINKVEFDFFGNLLGRRLLHIAATNKDYNTLKLLLKNGANPYVYDANHITPVDIAISNGDLKILKLFLSHMTISSKHISRLRNANKVHTNCSEILKLYETFKADPLKNIDKIKVFSPNTLIQTGSIPPLSDFQRYSYLDLEVNSGYDLLPRLNIYDPLLIIAIKENDYDAFCTLIDSDADVNIADSNGDTVLHKAFKHLAKNGSKDYRFIEKLLENGADLAKANKDEEEPFVILIRTLDLTLIEKALKKYPNLHKTVSCPFAVLHELIVSKKGWTPKITECYKLLLKYNFDVAFRYPIAKKPGESILVEGTFHSSWAMIRDISASIITPISFFQLSKQVRLVAPIEIFHLTLEKDINIDEKSYQGETMLITAAKQHTKAETESDKKAWLTLIVKLLKRGADVNLSDKNSMTALHHAAASDDDELVDLLLEHSANIEALDDQGKTPSDLAREKGHVVLATMIENTHLEEGFSMLFSSSHTEEHEIAKQPTIKATG